MGFIFPDNSFRGSNHSCNLWNFYASFPNYDYDEIFGTKNHGLKVCQFFHLPFFLICFTIPYVLTGIFLGPEFPSIIGGQLG